MRKILNILSQKTSFINQKFLEKQLLLLESIFPFYGTLSYFFITVEILTYTGSLRKFIFVDSRFFLITLILYSAVLCIFQIFLTKKTPKTLSLEVFYSISFLAFPVLLFIYYALLVTEKTNYPNYVYSHFHIQLHNFKYIIIANLEVNLTKIISSELKFTKLAKTLPAHIVKNYIRKENPILSIFEMGSNIFVSILIGAFIVYNLILSSDFLVDNYLYIFKHPFASYDTKMENTWGNFYKYMQLVNQVVPESSSIAIPPTTSHWLTTGNSVLVRYFIYPRKIATILDVSNPDVVYQLPNEEFDYILLDPGTWNDPTIPFGWPKTSMPVKNIAYFDLEAKKITIVETNWFDASSSANTTSWGVISLQPKN